MHVEESDVETRRGCSVVDGGESRAQAPAAEAEVRPFAVAPVKQSPPPNPNGMMVRPGSPGLPGIYEFDLEFDYAASRGIGASPDGDTDGGSVFTAVQEHLGLKPDPRRETMDVLVIESVDMPSGN